MSSQNSGKGEAIAPEIGAELVHLLYHNTGLNYHVCAQNLIEVFEHLSQRLPSISNTAELIVDAIKNSTDENPDLLILYENLSNIQNLKNGMETGELNFYEIKEDIKSYLSNLEKLSIKTSGNVYRTILEGNREFILNQIDVWKMCHDKEINLRMIKLITEMFYVDHYLIDVIFDHTNFIEELCFLFKDFIELKEIENICILLKTLTIVFTNCKTLTGPFQEFLKNDQFLEKLLLTLDDETYISETSVFDKKINDNDNYNTAQELAICCLLSLNNHFLIPDSNIVLGSIKASKSSHGELTEKILKFLNFEVEPLKQFQLKDEIKQTSFINESFNMNSVIKFFSDLYSTPETSQLLYSNDFLVLIDILIRKIANLSCENQIRVDYVSLIDLIIRNSDYLNTKHRFDELHECFKSIANERDDTLEKDIVRRLLVDMGLK